MMNILTRLAKPISPIFSINHFRFFYFIFLAGLILFSLPASDAHPAQVTLAWDASTGSNIAGYKVYYGNLSGSYQAVIDVGNITTCTISNLPDGITYYFAATDYNTSGIESGYSNEVVYNPNPPCTYSISPTTQSYDASGGLGTVSVAAQTGCTWTDNSNATWLIITSNGTGTGNGTVNYSVSVNSSTGSRNGTMTIAGKTFTVYQSGASLPNSYTITALAGVNGSISPSGTVAVNSGASQSFTITPAKGYQIADVKVDGVSVGRKRTYSFTNVAADHTINASFRRRMGVIESW